MHVPGHSAGTNFNPSRPEFNACNYHVTPAGIKIETAEELCKSLYEALRSSWMANVNDSSGDK